MRTPADRTKQSLRELASVVTEASAQLQDLAAQAEALLEALEGGRALREVMAEEPRPLVITQLTALTDELQLAGGEVRRAEAFQLRSEGLTHEQIAAVFGVTRQRAAALLKDSAAPRTTPKRPGGRA